MNEIEYVLVPKNTLDAQKISSDHTLTLQEVQILMVHREVIKKFILQRWLSMQFDIWAWLWGWKEILWQEIIKALVQIWEEIGTIDQVFEKYVEQEKMKEENKLDK